MAGRLHYPISAALITMIMLAWWVYGQPLTRLTYEPRLPTLFIIGDSTVNNSTKGQMGWGNVIAAFFDTAKIRAGYKHPAMVHDVLRAIRVVRANAEKWKLDPTRIGVMGSSAGGHLAATALTHFDGGDPNVPDPIDRVSSRPNLGILCYPVITMGANTHAGSKRNLLGDNPEPKLVELLSNEKQVTKDTPPTFIFHTYEDAAVKVENALEFAAALRRNGVPFSLHIYPKGAHGLGLGGSQWDPENRHPWTTQCAIWLREQRFGIPPRDTR